MIKDLIFDRTAEDVVKVDKNSLELQKGAWNYIDLSRIEFWCQFIKDRLEFLGYKTDGLNIRKGTTIYQDLYAFKYEDIEMFTYEELQTFFSWHMSDIPTLVEINRIRNNVDIIKNLLLENSNLVVEFSDNMNYEKANIIEQILYESDKRLSHIEKQIIYCGTFSCGESSIIF